MTSRAFQSSRRSRTPVLHQDIPQHFCNGRPGSGSFIGPMKKLYQHRPQIAWKGISDFLQFVSSQFTRYIFFHRYISGQETNQNTDIKYNQTWILEIYIKIILRTPTRTRIKWHLQWHPLWQPPLRSANPDPYTHQMTASMTPCVTTARSWICEPTPAHTSEDYTSNDTLCDSPVLDLRILTPTHTRRHLQRHPVWQPGLGSANPDPYTHQTNTSNDTLWQPGLGSANPDPYTHQTTPPTTPCVTAPPATNPPNLRSLTPQLEVRTPTVKAIWGKRDEFSATV